jgi:integrase/recombinase XerD
MPRFELSHTYAEDLLPLDDLTDIWKRDRPLNDRTRTYSNYESAFARFARYLGRTGIDVPRVRDLAPDRLNEFLLNGSERVVAFAPGSQASHASNIRSLVSSCRKLGLVPADTLRGYELPRVPDSQPRWFSDAEVARVFDQLDLERTSVRLRVRAASNLALDNGARPDEIVGIRMRDILCNPGEVRLMGKGNRERIVPIGASTITFIGDYLRVRPNATSPDEPLFLDVRDPSKGIDATRLSGDFTEVLRAAAVPTGGGGDGESGCTFYSLRRTFARRSAEEGMDVAELAAIMGHSPNSIPMLLKHYYAPTRLHMLRAHASARPADGLHDWRHRVRPADRAVAVTLFEREATRRGARILDGNRRFNPPPSAKRWSGE